MGKQKQNKNNTKISVEVGIDHFSTTQKKQITEKKEHAEGYGKFNNVASKQ